MAVKFSNNAYSTLSANITNSATSFDVASVATFPTLGGSDHMYLSIIGSSYVEIIKVTGVSGTTLTCVRSQDGTTGTAADSGDRVELRVTTAMLTDAIADSNADIFNTIAVSGQSSIVADSTSDTLTIVGSGGTSVTTNAGTDTLTISSTTVPDDIFKTIAVSGQSDIVADNTTDTLTFVGSGGTAITTNAGTDTVTFTSPAQDNVFNTITVSGQSDIVADSATDTLTLVGSGGTTITTNAGTDTLTIDTPTAGVSAGFSIAMSIAL